MTEVFKGEVNIRANETIKSGDDAHPSLLENLLREVNLPGSFGEQQQQVQVHAVITIANSPGLCIV